MINNKEFKNVELTDAQIDKIDQIHSAVYNLCVLMSEKDNLEWSMSYIGEIADCAMDILLEHGVPVRYPAVVSENDEPEHVQEWFMPEK